jgi:hypothetical protein
MMIGLKKFRYIILILFFVLITGCGTSDKDKVGKVIQKYNESLPMAYEDSTDIVSPLATDKEQGRLEIFKTQLADQKKRIKVELISMVTKDIKFTSPKKKDDGSRKNMGDQYKQRKTAQIIDPEKLPQAVVQTEELWKYQYVDTATLKTVQEWKTIKYLTTYTLVQIEGNWFINDLKFEEKVLG